MSQSQLLSKCFELFCYIIAFNYSIIFP